MTEFAYTAVPIAQAGAQPIEGRESAPSESALRSGLRSKGLVAVAVRPVRLSDSLRAAAGGAAAGPNAMKRADRAWFFQTLSLLLSSSVPVEGALAEMERLAPNERLERACASLRKGLRSGKPLSVVLMEGDAVTRGLAEPRHTALLRSGEASGRLAHAVTLIDRSITSSDTIRRALVGKLLYPAMLIAVSIIAVWVLGTAVIPKFAETLTAMGGDLPFATRATLTAAEVGTWLVPILAVVLGGLILMRKRLLSESQRLWLAGVALRTPILGSVLWHSDAAIACEVLATMLEGGADIVSALDESSRTVRSPILRGRLLDARARIREGVEPGRALTEARVLPPLLAAVVGVGTRAGELLPALRRSTALGLEKQELLMQRAMIFLEPAIVFFVAGIVFWIVYSLVVGMLAMSDIAAI